MEVLIKDYKVSARTMQVMDLDNIKVKSFLACALRFLVLFKFKECAYLITYLFLKFQTEDAGPNTIWKEPKKVVSCQAPQTLAGHTGYLTVATLPPTFARFSQEAENGSEEPA